MDEITVRINSGGGDPFAAQQIGDLLETHSARVTARIGGLCASAATIVASHCDKVIATNDSTYMVHPVRLGICGYVDAEGMQRYLDALAAIKESIINLYVKKTGRDKDEITGWMDKTSWWTAAEAKEKGFIDELTDQGTPTVVENRSGVLFVNSVGTDIRFAEAPGFVQDSSTAQVVDSVVSTAPAVTPEHSEQEGEVNMDIKNEEDLRARFPELVDAIEKRAAQASEKAERERIQQIEDAALPGSEALTAKAKFETPMPVSEFAMELVKNAKAQGAAYLAQLAKDAEQSGVNDVGNVPTPENQDSVPAAIAQAKQDAAKFLNSVKKGGK